MAIVGYARVSTLDQDHTTQIERLKEANCMRVYSEKMTGTTKTGRKELDRCINYIREGDTLVVTKIDRLARSARDLYNIIHQLDKEGVNLNVLDQSIDTSTPHGKAFLGMLAIFAEFETNIRKERQLEGIAHAKKNGVYKGRKPTARAKKEEILTLLSDGVSKPRIAKLLGISVSSVYNVIKYSKNKDEKISQNFTN